MPRPLGPGSASSRVRPMTEFSGVRSSWLTLAQNRSLDSDAARSCSDFSSSSRTARRRRGWSARVRRTARCTGPSRRGWSPASSALSSWSCSFCRVSVLERRDQVLVLSSQFVQRGLREHAPPAARATAAGRAEPSGRRLVIRTTARRPSTRVHQPGGGGDALRRRLAVDRDGQHQVGRVGAERDDGGLPGGDGAPAHLAERGGDPDLVLAARGRARRPARGRAWRAAKTPARSRTRRRASSSVMA